MKTRFCLLVSLLVSISLFCFNLTSMAYNYENTGLSARVLGLGYTFVGIADDPTTLYWNPGGIARVGGCYFTSSNPYSIPGYNVTNLSISYPLATANRFKFDSGVGFFYSSEIGKISDGTNFVKTGENRLGIGIGALKGEFSLGCTIWSSQLTEEETKKGDASIDLGMLWKFENAKAGVVIRNIVADAPLETILGSSYKLPLRNINVIQDIIVALDMMNCYYDGQSDFSWNAGLEAALNSGLVIRFGFNDINPSLGLGFTKKAWCFDYALSHHELGNSHYLSVGYEL